MQIQEYHLPWDRPVLRRISLKFECIRIHCLGPNKVRGLSQGGLLRRQGAIWNMKKGPLFYIHNSNKGGISFYPCIFNSFLHHHAMKLRHLCISQKLMVNQPFISPSYQATWMSTAFGFTYGCAPRAGIWTIDAWGQWKKHAAFWNGSV